MDTNATEADDLASLRAIYDRPLSTMARGFFSYLNRRGGSVRIGPLLRHGGLNADQLVAAANELANRRMVTIIWRAPRARMPEGLPERFREVERICTTRWGRHRYAISWPTL